MHFEQRILPKEPDQIVMKTSAGVEIMYVSPSKQTRELAVAKPAEETKEKEALVIPTGMTKEAAELYNDLEKWSFSSLKSKFVERIQTHLRVNPASRD